VVALPSAFRTVDSLKSATYLDAFGRRFRIPHRDALSGTPLAAKALPSMNVLLHEGRGPMCGNEDAVTRDSGTLGQRRGFGSGSAGLVLSAAAIGATAGAMFAFAIGGVFPVNDGAEYKIQADAFTPPSRQRIETASQGQAADNDDCAGQAWPNFSEACIISKGRVAAKAPATISAPPPRRADAPTMNPQRAAALTQPIDPVPRVASAAPAAALSPPQGPEVETTGSAAPSTRVPLPAPRVEPAPAQRTESQPPPLQSVTLKRSQPAIKKPQPKKRAKAKPRRREPEGDDDSSFERRTVERSYDWLDRDHRRRDLDPRGSRGHRFADRGDGNGDESPRRRRVIVIERGSDDFFGQLFRF
jgi:hypothetical protein